MKVLVDCDGCPVVPIVEKVAKEFKTEVILLCDIHHRIVSDTSKVIVVDSGQDAVDFALVGICEREDIVVTQDYGVAVMALGKGAKGIHQSGKWYTNENIDQLLMERHIAKKLRNSKKKARFKKIAKRTSEDDIRFEASFRKLINLNVE